MDKDQAVQLMLKQAVELLKTAQLIGNKSDLAIKEESTLFDIKQLLCERNSEGNCKQKFKQMRRLHYHIS